MSPSHIYLHNVNNTRTKKCEIDIITRAIDMEMWHTKGCLQTTKFEFHFPKRTKEMSHLRASFAWHIQPSHSSPESCAPASNTFGAASCRSPPASQTPDWYCTPPPLLMSPPQLCQSHLMTLMEVAQRKAAAGDWYSRLTRRLLHLTAVFTSPRN